MTEQMQPVNNPQPLWNAEPEQEPYLGKQTPGKYNPRPDLLEAVNGILSPNPEHSQRGTCILHQVIPGTVCMRSLVVLRVDVCEGSSEGLKLEVFPKEAEREAGSRALAQ